MVTTRSTRRTRKPSGGRSGEVDDSAGDQSLPLPARLTCDSCARYIGLYCPTCLQCGARYLAAIQAHTLPLAERRAWWAKALADWVAMGHDAAVLKRLASKEKEHDAAQ